MKRLHSIIPIQSDAATLKDNRLRMVASATGVLLSNGGILLPGCFKKSAMREAIANGWLDVNHNWDGKPIGTLEEITMQGDKLHIEAEFHTHEAAQEQRKIISERLDRNKTVAVSLGYGINYEKVKTFNSGKEFLEWCDAEGYDTSGFDPAIKKANYCWAMPEVDAIYEASPCNVGKNKAAMVYAVNSDDSDNNDDLSGEVLSLSDALDTALGVVERAEAVHELRKAKGSRLGDARLNQLLALQAKVSALIADAQAPTQEEQKRAATVRQKLLLAKATLAGV
jgi:hypothetical protein